MRSPAVGTSGAGRSQSRCLTRRADPGRGFDAALARRWRAGVLVGTSTSRLRRTCRTIGDSFPDPAATSRDHIDPYSSVLTTCRRRQSMTSIRRAEVGDVARRRTNVARQSPRIAGATPAGWPTRTTGGWPAGHLGPAAGGGWSLAGTARILRVADERRNCSGGAARRPSALSPIKSRYDAGARSGQGASQAVPFRRSHATTMTCAPRTSSRRRR